MLKRVAVRLVRVGPGGALVLAQGSRPRRLEPGRWAWLPLEARLDGDYQVVIGRAEQKIENK